MSNLLYGTSPSWAKINFQMNRKQFIFSLGAGIFTVLPGQASSTISDRPAEPSGGQAIPRKAIIPAALSSIDKNGKIDFKDFNIEILLHTAYVALKRMTYQFQKEYTLC